MKALTITHLARMFHLSRSTLLYYERRGLLTPSERSASGYRLYDQKAVNRLDRICLYKSTGLPLEKIKRLLDTDTDPKTRVLEKRLEAISREIEALRVQQTIISNMLGKLFNAPPTNGLTQTMMTDLLRAAGLDDQAMMVWHAEFERRSPQAHHDFLLYLGMPDREALKIREHVSQITLTEPGEGVHE